MGRKAKLTPEIITKAVDILVLGNYIKTTCDCLDIHQDTWCDWINGAETAKGKKEQGLTLNEFEELKIRFSAAVKKAQGQAVVNNMKTINTAAEKNWQAAAWTLERTKPEMFGLQQRIIVEDSPHRLSSADILRRLKERKQEQIIEVEDYVLIEGEVDHKDDVPWDD